MPTVGPNLSERTPHDEAEELLPWYATGELDEADRARVDAHLSSCAHCRRQLELEGFLVHEFQAMVPEVEAGWTRLRDRIEAPSATRKFKPARPSPFAKLWSFLSRPAVAMAPAAQLAFVIVAGAVLVSLRQPAYHTLGSAPAPAAANVIIMFRPDATERDIRAALRSADASLVDGPTPANAYLLHVAAARRPLALKKLQSDREVQLAQPIDGAGS